MTRFNMVKQLYGDTPLTNIFFTEQNIASIQNLLRYKVYQITSETIDNQDRTRLLILMQSVFKDNARHPEYIKHTDSREKKDFIKKALTDETRRLNEITVESIKDEISEKVYNYKYYLGNIDTQPVPLPLPKSTNTTGTRGVQVTKRI